MHMNALATEVDTKMRQRHYKKKKKQLWTSISHCTQTQKSTTKYQHFVFTNIEKANYITDKWGLSQECSVCGLEYSVLLKCQFFLRFIYSFNVILITTTAGFLVEINKLIPKCIQKCKGTRVTETVLKKNRVGRTVLISKP